MSVSLVPDLKKFEVVDLEGLDPAKAEEAAKQLREKTLPELKSLEGLDPAKAEEAAKQLREKTLPELKRQIESALSWLANANGISREAREILEAEIAKKQNEEEAKAAQEGREPGIQHPRKWLDFYLGHNFGPYHRTAWLALVLYHLNVPKTEEQAKAWLTTLVKRGRLLEAENGTLTIFGKNYSVAAEANLGEPELRQLRQAVLGLENRIAIQERQQEREKQDAILKEGKLSTQQFFEGKPGLLSVMPTNGTGRTDGVLVVRTNGREVSPYKAIGTFRPEIEELAKTNKYLLVYILDREDISPSFFIEKARFNPREAELLMKFWQLLKSGINRKQTKEKVQALEERFAAKATITAQNYLVEGKPGICFLKKEGRWDWYDPARKSQTSIYNLFFVVERKLDETGKPCIRLVMRPAWLKEFFADCPADTWWPEGEKFADLPQNLCMVLQNLRGQTEKRLILETQKEVSVR